MTSLEVELLARLDTLTAAVNRCADALEDIHAAAEVLGGASLESANIFREIHGLPPKTTTGATVTPLRSVDAEERYPSEREVLEAAELLGDAPELAPLRERLHALAMAIASPDGPVEAERAALYEVGKGLGPEGVERLQRHIIALPNPGPLFRLVSWASKGGAS